MSDIHPPLKPLANGHGDTHTHRPAIITPPPTSSHSPSPTKRTPSSSPSDSPKSKRSPGRKQLPLPPGWERVKSEQGPYYYWEKKTGRTTWKFPTEEAKQHEQLLTLHPYENIELKNKKAGPPEAKQRNGHDDKISNGRKHSGEELPSAQSRPHSSKKLSYENVVLPSNQQSSSAHATPTAPVPAARRHDYEDVSPVNKNPPEDVLLTRERQPSDTPSDVGPPLPDRNYSESELHMSPTPSLPDRLYSYDSPSPPPLPERRYSNSEFAMAQDPTKSRSQQQQRSLPRRSTVGNLVSKDNTRKQGVTKKPSLQHEVTETGHEYAVVERKHSRGRSSPAHGGEEPVSGGIGELARPPVPKRAHERMKGGGGDTRRRSGEERRGYIEIEIPNAPAHNAPFDDSIAYAVVSLDTRPVEQVNPVLNEVKREGLPQMRRTKTPPRPYEIPSPSGSLTRGLTPPTYEEIESSSSGELEPEADGYMKVDPQKQRKYQRHQSTPNVTSPLDKTHRIRVGHSLDDHQDHTHDGGGTDTIHTSVLSPGLSEKSRSFDSEESDSRKSGGEESLPELSQDSIFKTNFDYDLPSNSRKLQSMNITLRRADPETGYAKLDLSREAILLRSGVTLRRFNRPSLSSLSSFSSVSREPSEPPQGDGSEDSETDTLDASSTAGGGYGEDEGLDPVDKCIKSLETSLGVSVETLDAEPMEEYIKMARAPVGPPNWINYKRRPHMYEEVPNSSQEGEGERQPSKDPLSSRSMSDLDLEWDETDMGGSTAAAKPVGSSFASTAGSVSQPNLLRDPAASEGREDVQGAFPHLEKPDRVSNEAFCLRKIRLLKHQYEDIEMSEWPEVEGTTVGDVNALTSAIRNSWLEGDKNTSGSGGESETLPKGWQRMKDEDGRVYYWHVPTGRTQYSSPSGEEVKRLSLTLDDSITSSPPSHSLETATTTTSEQKTKSHTFSARYLGFLPVAESQLVPGQCVRVVHSCINKMAASRGEQSSVDDKGRPVFLQIQAMELRWLDPSTNSPTTVQQINRIRVWGIGLENERDFGYVARDPTTRKHKCYLFRCDMPARAVARSLLESHQKQKLLKSQKPKEEGEKATVSGSSTDRSQSLESNGGRSVSPEGSESVRGPPQPAATTRARSSTSPSYIEVKGSPERYERVQCTYIGSCETKKGVGMEVLNEAVDKLCSNQQRWLEVNVDIATSHIKISDVKTNTVIREHRVRFLCFLGIAKDDRYCGYVLDSGERNGEKLFQFHGFRKEPNTDRLCLCLHTACQARYQRVLDANPDAREREQSKEPVEKNERKSSSSLFGRLGSFKNKKKPLNDERYVVQYLGSQVVAKPDGLETVREPIQQLAIPKVSTPSAPPHLVEFDVTPTGLSITDPQKKLFARKSFTVKNITYVVRMRNYFAFVARESGKFHCHVFLETEVDAGTIVGTIQKMLAPESSKQYKR